MAKKKLSRLKKFAIAALILIVGESIIIARHWREQPMSPADAIESSVEKITNATPRRKAQLKIQLALNDYIAKHGGNPPANLDELVPLYFTAVPLDPDTGAVFKYEVINGRPVVGRAETAAAPVQVATTGGATGTSANFTEEQQKQLIASLSQEQEQFVYDPTGKRDPFRPFDLGPKPIDPSGRTPLEMYDLGQLRLTAILTNISEPKAIIENSAGRGFTVTKGTKIGSRGGEIVDILKDRILILETTIDFTGKKQTETIEMRLRTKDQEKP